MSNRVHQARLVLSRTIAQDTQEYLFSHDDEMPFRPGQFISIQVSTDAEQNPVLRSYSLASSPGRRGHFALVLRLIQGGAGSLFFTGLHPGDAIRFTGPMGFFVNELSHPGDAVYVATGTGIAPIVPMVEEALSRPEPGRVLLYWGLRHEADRFWDEPLYQLVTRHKRLTYRLYVSQPSTGYTGLRGRVTGPVLDEVPSLSRPTFYLCGNGHMIDELKAALQSRGIDRKRQIRTEAFFD